MIVEYLVDEVSSLFRIVLEELLSFDTTQFYLKPWSFIIYVGPIMDAMYQAQNLAFKFGSKKRFIAHIL
jgi:hypothetical protein